MVAPSKEVWHLNDETDDPDANRHEDGVAECVDATVEMVVANVDVAVDADGTDGEQGAEAAGEADAGYRLAQTESANEPSFTI